MEHHASWSKLQPGHLHLPGGQDSKRGELWGERIESSLFSVDFDIHRMCVSRSEFNEPIESLTNKEVLGALTTGCKGMK